MRALSTILSIAALFWGFLQAPFLHIHAEEIHHPAAALTHLHVHAAHRVSGPAIVVHTANDDAFDVEWRIAPPSAAAFPVDLAVSGTVMVAPPPVVSIALRIPQPRIHDPPDLTPKQPRAPPA